MWIFFSGIALDLTGWLFLKGQSQHECQNWTLSDSPLLHEHFHVSGTVAPRVAVHTRGSSPEQATFSWGEGHQETMAWELGLCRHLCQAVLTPLVSQPVGIHARLCLVRKACQAQPTAWVRPGPCAPGVPRCRHAATSLWRSFGLASVRICRRVFPLLIYFTVVWVVSNFNMTEIEAL